MKKLGNLFARMRVRFLELRYALHIRARYMHDKTYEKGGWYKNWTDKPYSSQVHKATFVAFIISFVIFSGAQNLFPYLFSLQPRPAQAESTNVTWTSQADFTNNNGATGNTTFTPTGTIDLTTSSGNVQLAPAGETINTGTDTEGDLVVNGTTTLSGVHNYHSITINNGGVLTHAQGDATLELRVKTTLTINTGGSINLDGKGAAGGAKGASQGANGSNGSGTGFGYGGGGISAGRAGAGGGAGYGGSGGNAAASGASPGAGGIAYNNSFPELGSGGGGGGGGGCNSPWGGSGGNGGGRVKIQANAISLSGQISANGSNGGASACTSSGGGGGSGGGIHLLVASGTANAGYIQAKGGNGGAGGFYDDYNYGAGGGGGAAGRIKIQANTAGTNPIYTAGTGGPNGYGSGTGSSGTVAGDAYTLVGLYVSSGTLGGPTAGNIGLRFDAEAGGNTGRKAKASTLNWTATTGSNSQKVLFKVRSGDTQGELDSSACYGPTSTGTGCTDWSTTGAFFSQINTSGSVATNPATLPGGILNAISAKRYIEIIVRLEADGTNSPTLSDVILGYNFLDAPTTLKQYRSDGTEITSGSYTNESTAKLKADIGTPFPPSSSASPITFDVEVRNADSGWTGSPATPGGVTATSGSVSYSCADPGPCSALGSQIVNTLTGLSPGSTYYWRVRSKDGAGRQSAWSATSTAFTVDQTPPTVTSFQINSGAQYASASTRIVTASGIFNDTGGSSGTLDVQFSEDGTNWGIYSSGTTNNKATDWTNKTTVTASGNSQSIPNAWYLEGTDGAKTIYVRTRDAAGNLSGFVHSSTADFSGTPVSVSTAGNEIKLTTDSQVTYNDSIYSSGAEQFTPERSNLNATSVIVNWSWNNVDPLNYGSQSTLYVNGTAVESRTDNPQSGSETTVSFSGNRVKVSAQWEATATLNWVQYHLNSLPASGTYTSQVVDKTATSTVGFSALNWNDNLPAGTSVTTQVRASNNADASGGMDWTSVTKGQAFSGLAGWQNYRYLQYKLTLNSDAGHTLTPTVYDVNVGTSLSSSITLDTGGPVAFDLASPNDGIWQGSTQPTLSWDASSDAGSGLAKYQLYIGAGQNPPTLNRDNIIPGTACSGGNCSTTPASALSEGTYTWYIKAVDNAGNSTPSTSTRTIGIDNQAPSLTLDPGFTFSATDTNTNNVTLNWNTYADDSGNGAPAQTYSLERLKYTDYQNGSHTLTSTWSLGGDGNGSGYYNIGDKGAGVHQYVESVGANPENIEESVKYIYRIKVTDAATNVSAWLKSDTGMTADAQKPTNPSGAAASACDGTNNCSAPPSGKGYEVKLSWNPSTDNGSGVTGYKIYRKAESDSNTPADFTIVGYLDVEPPGSPVSTIYYDNDAGNDATFTDTINEVPNTVIKGSVSTRLNDFVNYYYRIVAIDAAGNQTDIITLDTAPPYTPNQTNFAATQTVDVTAPSVPADLGANPTGIDSLGGDPLTQGVYVSWSGSSDSRTVGRTPTGNGIDAVQYKLYRVANSGAACTDPPKYTGSNTEYTEEGLGEDTDYFYKVKATDSAGNASSCSSATTVRTKNSQVPTTPSAVTITAKTGDPNTDAEVGHKVTVNFTGSKIKVSSNRIDGYRIYRSTTNYPTPGQWTALTPVYTYSNLNIPGYDGTPTGDGQRSFDDTVSTDTTTYYYKVIAYGWNESNQENVESSLSAVSPGTLHTGGWDTTPDATEPATPADVKVKDIHGNDSMVRNIITWTMIADPLRNGASDWGKYQVWRYETNSGIGSAALIAEKTSRGDNYHVDGIANAAKDIDYSYYVVAVDNAGTEYKYPNGSVVNPPITENGVTRVMNNTSSHEAPVSINPGTVKPTVSAITSTGVSVSSATVNWNTDQNTDSLVEYRVKGTNDVVAAGKDRTAPTTSHSVGLQALAKNTPYEYRIVSRNSLGNIDETAASTWKEFATQDFSITPSPVEVTTTTATVRWITNIQGDSGVEYKKENSNEASQTAGDPQLAASHTVIIKGLKPATAYTYKIRSVTADKYIADTAFAVFTTKPYDASQFVISPSASNIAEQNITATSAKIVWNTAIATSTWVDYGTAPGQYTQKSGNDAFNTVHVVELLNLTPGTKYYYRVWGEDTSGIKYTSQEYSFTAVLKPAIAGASVKDISPYSATITWSTNVSTDTGVNLGKDSSYGQRAGKPEETKIHSVTLENLEDNTTYHYQIVVRDQFKNEAITGDATFSTPLDTEGPKITEVKIDLLPMGSDDETAQAIISWTTNKPSSTKIEYDEGVIGGKYSKSSIEDVSLNNSHTVIVKELNPSSTYHFRIVSKDKRSNETKSQDYTFVTPTKEKSILQLILKSLEETFSWVKNVGSFFRNLGRKTK